MHRKLNEKFEFTTKVLIIQFFILNTLKNVKKTSIFHFITEIQSGLLRIFPTRMKLVNEIIAQK